MAVVVALRAEPTQCDRVEDEGVGASTAEQHFVALAPPITSLSPMPSMRFAAAEPVRQSSAPAARMFSNRDNMRLQTEPKAISVLFEPIFSGAVNCAGSVSFRHSALPQKFHTVHPGFNAAPAVVSAPVSPLPFREAIPD